MEQDNLNVFNSLFTLFTKDFSRLYLRTQESTTRTTKIPLSLKAIFFKLNRLNSLSKLDKKFTSTDLVRDVLMFQTTAFYWGLPTDCTIRYNVEI
jgi:hypothetical protein